MNRILLGILLGLGCGVVDVLLMLPMTFPDRDKTYEIWVGLWRIRRDATRVRVVDKGSGTVDDNRVLVGRVTVR